MERKPAPPSIVDDKGRFRFGSYATPVFTPDFDPAHLSDVFGVIGRAHRRGVPRWLRRMRLKEWQHFSFVCDEFFVTAGIVHLGYAGNAFCRIVDRDTGRTLSFERLPPLGRGIRFAESSVRGTTSWRDGSDYMTFDYQPQAGGLWSCTFNLPFGAPGRLKGQVSVYPEPECVALVFPLHDNRAAYTHKEAGNRAEGSLTLGTLEMRFDRDGQAALDWTRSFADRRTRWNWLCAAGMTGDGRRVGLNLSQHVYGAAENYVWLDGMTASLGAVEFTPPAHAGEPWRIAGEQCALEMTPNARRTQRASYGVVHSRFTQHFGPIEGHLRFDGGLLPLCDLYSVCEQHDALW